MNGFAMSWISHMGVECVPPSLSFNCSKDGVQGSRGSVNMCAFICSYGCEEITLPTAEQVWA